MARMTKRESEKNEKKTSWVSITKVVAEKGKGSWMDRKWLEMRNEHLKKMKNVF